MSQSHSQVRSFEGRLDAAFENLSSWDSDGLESLYKIGHLIEECHATDNLPLAMHFEYGLNILAPRLIQQNNGRRPKIKALLRDLHFAGHYYALRDYLYYTYIAKGSCEWQFEKGFVRATFADRTLPRQYWLQQVNYASTSLEAFKEADRHLEIVAMLREAREFDYSEEVAQAMVLIEEEASEKLAHYFSIIPPESTMLLGNYRYCDFIAVARSLLTKALYHRYQATANGNVGAVHIGKDEAARALCDETGLTMATVRVILGDMTYSDSANREGMEPMYYGLFDLKRRDQILMIPHVFSRQDCLVNILRLHAKRDPSFFQSNVASVVDEHFQRLVRSIFEGGGLECHERVSLKAFDKRLPDVDLMAISRELTLGYYMYICELKGTIPPQWSKDHLRALNPDSVAKAFGQLRQVMDFLESTSGQRFLRSIVPADGLPHFGEEFLALAHPLIVTTNNAGMFFEHEPYKVIDYRTLRRIVDSSDGDVTYINYSLDNLGGILDETIKVAMVPCQVGSLSVEYEGVVGGQLFRFPEHQYRSEGVDQEIARSFILDGGHPHDVLEALEGTTSSADCEAKRPSEPDRK